MKFVCLLFALAPTGNTNFKNTLRLLRFERQNEYEYYKPLAQYVQQYDIVLADLETGGFVPPFSGKTIALPHSLHFTNNSQERRNNLNHFFDQTSDSTTRQQIIHKYKPNYLLLHTNNLADGKLRTLCQKITTQIYQNEKLFLYKISAPNSPQITNLTQKRQNI